MNPKKAKTKTAGVYRIDINGCYYFGSAVDLEVRRRNHFRLLKKGNHTNAYIQKFYNEGHKPKFKIVETCHREYVKFLEQTYLDAHHGKPKCLNIQPGAGVYLPVTLRREAVWNGVTYASRTEWALATGYDRREYVKFQKRGVYSDNDLIDTKLINRKKGADKRRKYATAEEKQTAKLIYQQKSVEKKRHERSQMIGKSCKLAVYFNGRYWESLMELCRNTGRSEYCLTEYIKLGAKCDADVEEMMRQRSKKAKEAQRVRVPIIINFEGVEFVFPNYRAAATAFGLHENATGISEFESRFEWAGIKVKPITKEEYYERQAKRAV